MTNSPTNLTQDGRRHRRGRELPAGRSAPRPDRPAGHRLRRSRPSTSRNGILAALIAALVADLERFEREGFGAFREDWMARHAYAGRRVTVLAPGARRAKAP